MFTTNLWTHETDSSGWIDVGTTPPALPPKYSTYRIPHTAPAPVTEAVPLSLIIWITAYVIYQVIIHWTPLFLDSPVPLSYWCLVSRENVGVVPTALFLLRFEQFMWYLSKQYMYWLW